MDSYSLAECLILAHQKKQVRMTCQWGKVFSEPFPALVLLSPGRQAEIEDELLELLKRDGYKRGRAGVTVEIVTATELSTVYGVERLIASPNGVV
ncbi:hypothetical protein [Streptomyces sp. NBC_00459]|uniref:hypothetical protein n=1 Tax=Streptomyces sp. NBC_00459 TaxID=2975749 RepID=UPI002E1941EC